MEYKALKDIAAITIKDKLDELIKARFCSITI